MQHFKGELKELKDIAPGSPVELEGLEDVVKKYKMPLVSDGKGDYVTEKLPKHGIINTISSGGLLQPNVTLVGEMPPVMVRGKATDPTRKVKVLTGTVGLALVTKWRAQQQDHIKNTFAKKYSFNLGSDPEVFVEDEHGVVIPAWEFLPGKGKPNEYRTTSGYYYGTTYWDGFQAEFTTYPVACANAVADTIRAGLMSVLKEARAKFPNAKLSAKSVMAIPNAMLVTAVDAHVGLGCGRSENAYGLEPVKVANPRALEFRPAGGHIHLGAHEMHIQPDAIVRAIDAIAGIAMVGILDGLDDPKRRTLYGRAGEYRLPQHGLEYRVLSNGWLRHPALMLLAVDLVRAGAHVHGMGAAGCWIGSPEEIQRIINECDVKGARAMVEQNRNMFCGVVHAMARSGAVDSSIHGAMDPETYMKAAYKVVMEGAGTVLASPGDIEKNWLLADESDRGAYYKAPAPAGKWISHAEGVNCQWRTAAKSIMQGQQI